MRTLAVIVAITVLAIGSLAFYHQRHLAVEQEQYRKEAIAAMETGMEYNYGLLRCKNGVCVFHLSPENGDPMFEVVTLTSGLNPQILEVRYEPNIQKLEAKGDVPKLLQEAEWTVLRPANQQIAPPPLPVPPLHGSWKIRSHADDELFQKSLKKALETFRFVYPTGYNTLFPAK